MSLHIRIGTRGSQLALTQSRWVQSQLLGIHPGAQVELVIIKTSGDRFVDRPLSSIGGKGLFVKEIEEAMQAGTIDCAVHSMKDVPNELARGLVLAAVPHREDPRDVLLSRLPERGLADLPAGARIGTSSLRRAALLQALRPDLQVESLRGNVDSRLRKLDEGSLDAIVLAAAGLRRLGIERAAAQLLSCDEVLPAVGQGALAIETRDDSSRTLVEALDHADTRVAVSAERSFLRTVGGSCRTPLAAYAELADGGLRLRALIASLDGRRILRGERKGSAAQAESLGQALGEELMQLGGAEILGALENPSER